MQRLTIERTDKLYYSKSPVQVHRPEGLGDVTLRVQAARFPWFLGTARAFVAQAVNFKYYASTYRYIVIFVVLRIS